MQHYYLPKKELHGQTPVVTYATKTALNQFEAQSKTRPNPPPPGQVLISTCREENASLNAQEHAMFLF